MRCDDVLTSLATGSLSRESPMQAVIYTRVIIGRTEGRDAGFARAIRRNSTHNFPGFRQKYKVPVMQRPTLSTDIVLRYISCSEKKKNLV
jgi:hypothetical protein